MNERSSLKQNKPLLKLYSRSSLDKRKSKIRLKLASEPVKGALAVGSPVQPPLLKPDSESTQIKQCKKFKT
jgi:hypothetical protein